MAYEITHTTQKNDAKEVTGYEIKVDGVTVGTATKDDKGKFHFTTIAGAAKDSADHKTMRDLKVQVGKDVEAAYLKANAPAPKPKAEKASKTTKADEAEQKAATAEPAPASDEDVDLD